MSIFLVDTVYPFSNTQWLSNSLEPKLYRARSRLTLPTLSSNSRQNLNLLDYFRNNLFLQKLLLNPFELLTWPQKIMFWHPFWCFLSRCCMTMSTPPHFCLVLLLLQTTLVLETSSRARVRSPVRCKSTSSQFPVPGRVECMGRRVLS
jgi:hypothetical protein